MSVRFYYTDQTGIWVVDEATKAASKLASFNEPGNYSPSIASDAAHQAVFAETNAGGRPLQLAVSNGTQSTTGVVRSFSDNTPSPSASDSAALTGFTTLNSGKVLFDYNDGTGANALYLTDGTLAGTVAVSGYAAAGANGPYLGHGQTAQLGTHLFFTDAAGLAVLDESTGAATRLSNFGDTTGYASLAGQGSRVLFASPGNSGAATPSQLWSSDGTVGGTAEIVGFAPGTSLGGFVSLLNGDVLFEYDNGGGTKSLYITDGTTAGTKAVSGYSYSGAGSPYLGSGQVAQVGNNLAFTDPTGLWVVDQTTGVATKLSSFSNTSGYAAVGYAAGQKFVFAEPSGSGTYGSKPLQLWSSDGTKAGTALVAPFQDNNPSPVQIGTASDPAGLSGFVPLLNGEVLFSYQDGSGKSQIWLSDGTASGTTPVSGYNPGSYHAASLAAGQAAEVAIAPAIAGLTAGDQAVIDTATIKPFATTTVTDPDSASAPLVFSVTLSNAADGSLASSAGGSYNASSGAWTFAGNAATGTAALDNLVFTPTPHQVAAGATVATKLGLVVFDGAAGTYDNSTSVVATATAGSGGSNGASPVNVTLKSDHTQYIVAKTPDNAAYIQDLIPNRDGVQIIPNAHDIIFTDGVGIFDPTGTAEDVARVYQAALHRQGDAGGIDYWTNAIDHAHASLADVAAGFTQTTEFVADYGALSTDGFVRQLYQNVLNRAGDPGGIQYWDNTLATGATRGQVLAGFAQSYENRANTRAIAGDKNDAEAYRLYQAGLDRTPDDGGDAYWSNVLSQGASPAEVAQGFMQSSEFQTKYGTLDNPGYVNALYNNVLNRDADAGGLQYWVNSLAQGGSRQQILADFADSLENRVHTAQATHDSWVFIKS